MSRYYRSILNVQGGAVPLDPDAEAFLLAASITDATITSAIDTLVKSLKADSIWTKMTALYPFVGGTASTHKFNLKNPADSDAAFRLTFVGSPAHNSNGVTGNGTSQYARLHMTPNNLGNNTFGGMYTRTNSNLDVADFGVSRVSPTVNVFYMYSRWSDNNCYFYVNGGNAGTVGVGSPSDGFNAVGRTSDTDTYLIRKAALNNVVLARTENASSDEIYIMADNLIGTGARRFSSRVYCSFYFGADLSTTDATNLRTIDLAFHTALTRNV